MTRSEAFNVINQINQSTKLLEELADAYPEVWSVNRAYEHAINAEENIAAFFHGLIYEDDRR